MSNQVALVTGYEIAILTVLDRQPNGLSVTEIVEHLDGRLEATTASKTCQRMRGKGLIGHAAEKATGSSGPGRPKVIYLISEDGRKALRYWTLSDEVGRE